MISKVTERFRSAFRRLPKDIQREAQESYKLFRQNPNHPSLRFKKVHATEPIWAARINIDYRAVGYVDGDEVIWFWIGSHSKYELLLSQL